MENLVATISEVVNTVASSAKIGYDVAFPNIGIFIKNLKNTITIGNFTIAYYGIIIAVGMLVAFSIVTHIAKKLKIDDDIFYDIFIIVILLGIIGARAYYVIFRWDYYQIRPYEILDIRAGGLAVFGGIILAGIGIVVYCLIKKINFLKVLDLTMIGVVIGQAIGRYGNFFNMEAFGEYTNNLLAMRLRLEYLDPSNVTFTQSINVINENGVEYIQAHPTFLYESTLNLILFGILVYIILKRYKFDGQILATYLFGYGIIRFFVESLRTDSLMAGSLRVSQIVSIICVVSGIVIYILHFKKIKPFDKVTKVSKNMKAKKEK